MARRQTVVVFLSAPPEVAREELHTILAEHEDSKITVYLRETHRHHYEDLIAECFVQVDKPTNDRRSFIQELRGVWYDEAIVLDYGHWSFFPARCLFFLVRAEKKTVRTERGPFRFSFMSPIVLLHHWLYRRKNRTGSVAGIPPGTPFPFVVALYRKTIGSVIGLTMTTAEYGWRRVTR